MNSNETKFTIRLGRRKWMGTARVSATIFAIATLLTLAGLYVSDRHFQEQINADRELALEERGLRDLERIAARRKKPEDVNARKKRKLEEMRADVEGEERIRLREERLRAEEQKRLKRIERELKMKKSKEDIKRQEELQAFGANRTIVVIGCLGDLGLSLINTLVEMKRFKIICIDSSDPADTFPQLWRPFITAPAPPPSSFFSFLNASVEGASVGSLLNKTLGANRVVGVIHMTLFTLSWPSEVCQVVPHLCERAYIGSTSALAATLVSSSSKESRPWLIVTSSRIEVHHQSSPPPPKAKRSHHSFSFSFFGSAMMHWGISRGRQRNRFVPPSLPLALQEVSTIPPKPIAPPPIPPLGCHWLA